MILNIDIGLGFSKYCDLSASVRFITNCSIPSFINSIHFLITCQSITRQVILCFLVNHMYLIIIVKCHSYWFIFVYFSILGFKLHKVSGIECEYTGKNCTV